MVLTAVQRDRARGALLATAAGDALGAGHEFDGPRGPNEPVAMIGGGLGPGADLGSEAAQDAIVARWY